MYYFDRVYLSRINKYGETLQERIGGQMEADFSAFLNKSINKVEFLRENQKFNGVLQTEKISEKEIIDYLLVEKKLSLQCGEVIRVRKNRGYENWMVLLYEDYKMTGYNKYKVILLDKQVNWIYNNQIFSSYAHYVGEGTPRDRAIRNNFKIFDNMAIELPSKVLYMVLPYHESFGRDVRFNLNDSTWVVKAYDKESVEGVIYATLEEDYTQTTGLPDEQDLIGWNLESSVGDIIQFDLSSSLQVEFLTYYNTEARNLGVIITNNNDTLIIEQVSENTYNFSAAAIGEYNITVAIQGTNVIKEFTIQVENAETNYITLSGPRRIRLQEVATYEINSNFEYNDYTVTSSNNNVDIIKYNNYIEVIGKNIGKDVLTIVANDISSNIELDVISFWM